MKYKYTNTTIRSPETKSRDPRNLEYHQREYYVKSQSEVLEFAGAKGMVHWSREILRWEKNPRALPATPAKGRDELQDSGL